MFGFTGKLKQEIASLKSKVEYLTDRPLINNLQENLAKLQDVCNNSLAAIKEKEETIERLRQHAKYLCESIKEKEKTIKELENKVQELTADPLTKSNFNNPELISSIKIKDLTNTVIEKDKIIKTLINQLHLEKVYSVKNAIIVTLKIVDKKFTTKTYQSVNQAAKNENVDVSWLTKKLKSGNGVAIVNNIQFVLVRI